MKLLFIEPFFGGSHRVFAQGLQTYSSHDIDLLTLPDRNWTWRMHGSALILADRLRSAGHYDGIITSNMMRLSDLKALVGRDLPPVLVYFHESQLTYPPAPGEKQDTGLAISEITTALLADKILFNSRFHQKSFISAIETFMQRVPDYPVTWATDVISEKSGVLYPGLDYKPDIPGDRPFRDTPLIVWNHRWSYDKNAPSFFYALDTMIKRGLGFELALLGECPGWIPKEFEAARNRLGKRVVQYGYLENRDDYIAWLGQGCLAVSTARQENFGMSMVEAMKYGCLPLLPHRLSYPEILPEVYHTDCLYTSQKEFLDKMERFLTDWNTCHHMREDLSKAMDRFSWSALIDLYDETLENLCRLKTD